MSVQTRAPARTVARAEPIGSLLRSPAIVAQVEHVFERSHTSARSLVIDREPERVAQLHRLADAEIGMLLQRQIDAGLDIVTDGEIRRGNFLAGFHDSLGSLAEPDGRIELRDDEGHVTGSMFAEPVFRERLRKQYAPAAEEVAFLRAATDHPFKVTLPAPSQFLMDFVQLDGTPYSSHAAFLEDAVAVTKQIVAEVVAAGARAIQFDFPIYPALVAERFGPWGSMIEGARSEGETEATLLDRALAADRAVVEVIPDGVTVALHVCRGNLEGGFWSGSLAPVAERIFNELPHGRFLFEWEDLAREGDYSPIHFVPQDRIMVMGLVSTKTPVLEDEDEIVRRIDAASRHLDVAQLAISPQCGFASMFGDRLVSAEDAQWRKLELVGRVADRVWGP